MWSAPAAMVRHLARLDCKAMRRWAGRSVERARVNVLLIDFGSTYTKLRAVGTNPPRVLASGQGPSTVTTDVTVGMNLALADLEQRLGNLPRFDVRLACSSAAGGLRMVAVGLVRELTLEAARQAALGAGAKLVGSFAQRLTRSDVNAIVDCGPDIVLLAGGTDGGNSEVIVANARALAQSPLDCPVVVAGNRAVSDEIAACLIRSGTPAIVTENVMAEFGALNIEPAREAIRNVFIERIVHAKGIDAAAERFDAVLMPTPAAVMEGARLLAEGSRDCAGLGPLVVVDVGGATTDVHSVTEGESAEGGVVRRGLPEPYVKRTVEGDLGVRHNAQSIVQAAGVEDIAIRAALAPAQVVAMVGRCTRNAARLPETDEERRLDAVLARAATRLAVKRHAGTIETVHTATGPVVVQYGKDLRDAAALVATGGVFAHGLDPAFALNGGLAHPDEPLSLRPRRPDLLLDAEYLLYAAGLLGSVDPQAAVVLARENLVDLEERRNDGRSAATS